MCKSDGRSILKISTLRNCRLCGCERPGALAKQRAVGASWLYVTSPRGDVTCLTFTNTFHTRRSDQARKPVHIEYISSNKGPGAKKAPTRQSRRRRPPPRHPPPRRPPPSPRRPGCSCARAAGLGGASRKKHDAREREARCLETKNTTWGHRRA